MKPFWVTFYSYKGGVGRSLALANVAALLVQKGRSVLLIDFDLEAPGLDSFTEFSPAAGKPGVVEYVSEFIRHKTAPDIGKYIHRCELPGSLRGELLVMPAGKKDTAYNHQLNRIDWADLYDSGLGAPFFENWKATINQQFQPDYVFVDSRTGLTEVGGVCTTQFPDLVLMLFGLNEQNIRGIATVAKSIQQADPERVPQLHFVATPVPNLPSDPVNSQEKRSPLTERLNEATKVLGVKIDSLIRYYAPASLNEKLFALDDGATRQTIHGDYEELAKRVIKFNRTGLDVLLDQAKEAIGEGDLARIDRISMVLQRDYQSRAEAVYTEAQFAIAHNDVPKAVSLAEKAFNQDPTYVPPYYFLLSHFNRKGETDRVLGLFDTLLAQPNKIAPSRRNTLEYERADTLMSLGRYQEAVDIYKGLLGHFKNEPGSVGLVRAFNTAEAFRRASGNLSSELWNSVLTVFSHVGVSSDAESPTQANRWQAMHIAFAATGDLDSAKDALRKARRAAEAVGEVEDIFCVKSFRSVSVTEFICINDDMLAALDRGELWDGMKLAVSAPLNA